MTKQTELFPELGPQQLQPTGRVTFELVQVEPNQDCLGCAFLDVPRCDLIPGVACTNETMYRLVENTTC